MDQLLLDPYAVLSLAMGGILAVCTVIMWLMRDPTSAPPRAVSAFVWCPSHRQRAEVRFVERVRTGLATRAVRRCSLLAAGDRCNEACLDVTLRGPTPRAPASPQGRQT